MILAIFHGYAYRRVALLIPWFFRWSPWLLLSAIDSLFFHQIRQVCRSKWAQRNDLTHAANSGCLTLVVLEHGLQDHQQPMNAFMIILPNMANITCWLFWLVCLVCYWYVNFVCLLGLVHLIVGWSVGWLKVHFFSVVVAPVWPYVLYQALLWDGIALRALHIDCYDFFDVKHIFSLILFLV